MSLIRRHRPVRIGEFVLDPGPNELRRGQSVQRLPAKLADLLLRLAAEPGRMVARETLLDEVWERRQVNDEVLSRAIADLRQALGDEARAPRYIETLPKRGYRLVADVGDVAPDAESRPDAAAVHAPDREPDAGPAPSPAAGRSRRFTPRRALVAALFAATGLVYLARDDTPSSTAPTVSPAVADPFTAANLLRARPFTTEPGRELFPRFTPDARWVVYTRAHGEGEPAQLRLRAVDGTEDRVLVQDESDNLCGSVSPDGTTLAWIRLRPGVCEVVHRALLGGPARVLVACEPATAVTCPDWSPDGKHLLLAGNAEQRGLTQVAFPAGEARRLSTPPTGLRDLMPRYAPDGRGIVFWRGDAWGRSVHALDLHSGIERVLRPAAYLGFGHAIASDSSVILADDSLGQRALLRFDQGSGESTMLGGADARYPDLARNGALVYEVARYDANLWRVDLRNANAESQRLTLSARYDSQPAYSPDGQWLAFGSNRDGREGVYLMRPDGSEERKLPLDPALRWTSPVWFPDGERLLVLRYDADGAQFCLHTLATAQSECRPELGRNRHGAFFLDADTLGMIDAEIATPRLWRVRLDESTPAVVDVGVVDRCVANARWLACHRPGTAGVWLQDRQDGRARSLLPEIGDDRGAWQLHGNAIYYTAAEDAAAQRPAGIYRHDLDSGATRFVTRERPNAIGASIALAPDESALVLARNDGLETDLVYVPPPAPDQP
ncbi:MAG: winged helix-turn-helix domain-containing protein [Chiayiivirga sp.]|jgi:DNA-binding winged helix-turn-helix (wHTH) protein/Tol biopolymer transport system component|uniref:winged helix-turn-helix domain-containing protein n=1 Tax=Chiayiivirga sp. TaxID=2041042 RepID=UPI0025C507BF|nr:winged helix-turn-helix domain-containing protein [Chiayiivirga sp.]MCI1728118.1 winged helix-turn-helix domain-containing protein [Chiayiivirga sp.]